MSYNGLGDYIPESRDNQREFREDIRSILKGITRSYRSHHIASLVLGISLIGGMYFTPKDLSFKLEDNKKQLISEQKVDGLDRVEKITALESDKKKS